MSDNNNENLELNETAAESTAMVEDAAAALAALAAERDQLAAEKGELRDALLRRTAEFDNLRRRAEREKQELRETAGMEVVESLLAVVDDFERSLKVETQDANYAKGVELIYQRLMDTLKKSGLEAMEAKGQKFDPNLHHALDRMESEEHEDDTILDEYQRGYFFRGRLLRPAMVRVAVKK